MNREATVLLRTVSLALGAIVMMPAQGSAQQHRWTIGIDVGRAHSGGTSRDTASGDELQGEDGGLDIRVGFRPRRVEDLRQSSGAAGTSVRRRCGRGARPRTRSSA